MSADPTDSPALSILVCDQDSATADVLVHELGTNPSVSAVKLATSVTEAATRMHDGAYNIIFIDPLSLGLDEATDFIFNLRKRLPRVVFVLFIDRSAAEHDRAEFYSGPRTRFLHYFMVDKRAPVAVFRNETATALEKCRQYLEDTSSVQQFEAIRAQASRLARSAPGDAGSAIQDLSSKIDELLDRLPSGQARGNVRANTVFLSCRFADSQYIDGLTQLLADTGFEVITGDNASGYISETILERIRESEFFICLMTRDTEKIDGSYTTSPWLLEEKGAALAFGKYLVLLVEEGVTDFGGLQGDWQRHHFASKGFTGAALKAVKQLRSASGKANP
jgi:CheY-like chemotaxis protein